MELKVAHVDADFAGEWDSFVRNQVRGTPYHAYGWRFVIEEAFGHECVFLAARGANRVLRGVLPLVRVRSRIFGDYLVSMPFLNYGGPLGDAEAVRALCDAAAGLLDETRGDLLELRSAVELPTHLRVSRRKITVLLDLAQGDPEAVWKGLSSKVRSQVRRPMKDGIEVRIGPEELDSFYEVFARHMRDLGTPVLSKQLFTRAHQTFGSSMWCAAAYLEGVPVAAGCGFRWSDRFELVWAASLREHNRSAPNMLVYWRLIERSAEDGAAVFDFGRCTAGSGTHRFKTQWGGRDVPLWWYQHGPKAGRGTPSPDEGPFSLGPKLWRHLPLPVANLLGPRIVKFLP